MRELQRRKSSNVRSLFGEMGGRGEKTNSIKNVTIPRPQVLWGPRTKKEKKRKAPEGSTMKKEKLGKAT